MNYLLKFKKTGYMKYISHLDLMRLFKNTFKRGGIKLAYSKGFNPHPKMSFAQPLSLGYSSVCEILEFETQEDFTPEKIQECLSPLLPTGIKVYGCERVLEERKSLAALMTGAKYAIMIPAGTGVKGKIEGLCHAFMAQESIFSFKKQKKSAVSQQIDIKSKIQGLTGTIVDNNIILSTALDTGSTSNLSPELLISAFLEFTGLLIDRSEIEVERIELIFSMQS